MRPETATLRVMVVEDDDDSRDVVAMLLTNEGYEVSAFDNGATALEAMRRAPPDLVLLDLMMPVMDGWELRAAQKLDPALARIPVIVLTADASARARAIDAVRFLQKPFEPARLLATVRQVLCEVAEEREGLVASERLASEPGS